LDSANGGFSVEDVAAARERRASAVGRDAKRLSGAKRKRLGTAVVPRDKARWALFHDMLHTPWCAYVAGVLEGTGGNLGEAERRLRRCELVGSVASVVACKAPSFCGCEGIVVRDTARTIVLVTRKDDLVTVPKKGAVFAVEARTPTREKSGSDGSDGGGERRVRAVLEGDSLVRSG
jgi:RNase P/RNase MRP subunit p29